MTFSWPPRFQPESPLPSFQIFSLPVSLCTSLPETLPSLIWLMTQTWALAQDFVFSPVPLPPWLDRLLHTSFLEIWIPPHSHVHDYNFALFMSLFDPGLSPSPDCTSHLRRGHIYFTHSFSPVPDTVPGPFQGTLSPGTGHTYAPGPWLSLSSRSEDWGSKYPISTHVLNTQSHAVRQCCFPELLFQEHPSFILVVLHRG